ncbi:MAG TPA: hypothetical protein VK907_08635, partial [Phnomibacter sp.]|nr:hypothetical protein [Phnomibacter sp.]
MKKILSLCLLATALFTQSCNSGHDHGQEGGKSQNAAAPEMGPADAMFEEVMAFHDEAMPKMGKL